jgi:hypothetical protein
VTLTVPADRLGPAVLQAMDLERTLLTHKALQRLAKDHGALGLHALSIGHPAMEKDQQTFPVLRRTDGATLAVLQWPAGRHEHWEVTLSRFLRLMDKLQVDVSSLRESGTTPGQAMH